MTDKEIFKAELDRLKEETSIGLSEWGNGVEHGRMEIINALYKTLDSMQEEPVSEDLDIAAIEYSSQNKFFLKPTDVLALDSLSCCAKDSFIIGANWQKQQMMKEAKDGVITFDYYGDNDKIYGCIAHNSFSLEELGLKDGDKVKLIIIKEG